MSRHPETRFLCDRCKGEMMVPVMSAPVHVQMSGPPGWITMVIGVEPGTPPSHLCQSCANAFHVFMEGK